MCPYNILYPKQLYAVMYKCILCTCVARDTLRPMYKLNSTFPFIIYDRTSSSELRGFSLVPEKLSFFYFLLLIPSARYSLGRGEFLYYNIIFVCVCVPTQKVL